MPIQFKGVQIVEKTQTNFTNESSISIKIALTSKRRTTLMKLKPLSIMISGLLMSLTLTSTYSASAQPKTPQKLNGNRSLRLAPAVTFTDSANRGTKIVLSDGGNIISYLSPNIPGAEYEHIGVGAFSEGYVVCADGTSAYDTGDSELNFGSPTVSGVSPTTATVTRSTLDGRLKLIQYFRFDRQSLGIKMLLVNRSGSPLTNVILRRQVDFDIDTGGTNGWAGFINSFVQTSVDSVTAYNNPSNAPAGLEAHGMVMRNEGAGSGVTVTPKVTTSILDNSCSPTNVAATPAINVDYGATLEYNLGTLENYRSKSVELRYLRN
jgi:hypothetical protein